jgi:hypothetical protein
MGGGEGGGEMRTAWVNGALVAGGVAVVTFTVIAFRLPTQVPASTTPTPMPSLSVPAGQQDHAQHVVAVQHRQTHHHKPRKPRKPRKNHHHKPTVPVYVAPTYVPPYTPPPPPASPSPSPILATLPSGGHTQIPVPKHH